MATDTTSANLGLTLQASGNNDNTWGDKANTNFSYLEDAITEYEAISTTGGTTTLTSAQSRSLYLAVTGTLTSNATIEALDKKHVFAVRNDTTGSYTLTVKPAGGTGITIPQNSGALVHCDGSGAATVILRAYDTIDDQVIGATTPSSANFTQVNVDNLTLDVNTISSTDTNGNINLTPDGTGSVVISKIDANAGAIDGTTIGASSAAAGTFTTLSATSLFDVTRGTSTLAHFANDSGLSSTVQISLDPGDQGVGNRDAQIQATNDGSDNVSMSFWTANATTTAKVMTILGNGKIENGATYSNTTANAANMYIDSGGQFYRSTSTLKAKTDVQAADPDLMKQIVMAAEPIWYRSKLENDNPDWSWWGFGAEQIAKVDPRLVHFQTHEIIKKPRWIAGNGKKKVKIFDTEVKPLKKPKPDGVAYERFVVAHNSMLQQHERQIAALTRQISALTTTE